MRSKWTILALAFLFFPLSAQQMPGGIRTALPPTTTVPSSTIPSGIPTTTQAPAPSPAPAPTSTYVKKAPVQPIQQIASYFHPGILVLQGGQWVGTDHLLNMPKQIGVYVEVVKPEHLAFTVTSEEIQKQIETIFSQGRISPVNIVPPTAPPLPFFQLKVFIYPISNKGYAIFGEARLFESVQLARFKMDPNMAFQAITWQRQSLIVAPVATAEAQVQQLINELTLPFISVYQNYEARKREFIQ